MRNWKEEVLRLFLKFVGQFVPLPSAMLGTLGGRGIEPKLWKEAGIPPTHGHLVERNRKLSQRLVAEYRYRSYNDLRSLDQFLQGHGDHRARIDGFHLDLCGTLKETEIADITPVLPLVFASSARCFAITVSDERQNNDLEDFGSVVVRAKKLWGRKVQPIFNELERQQRLLPVNNNHRFKKIKPFDPFKRAKCEFGLMVSLAELFAACGKNVVPVRIERYVYRSRYAGKGAPFRMRTYFFHFESSSARNKTKVLASLWKGSPLYFHVGDHFENFNLAVTNVIAQPQENIIVMNHGKGSSSKLAELAKLVGGDIEAEFNALVADQQRLLQVQSALGVALAGPAAETAHRAKKRTWEDLSGKEQILWAIKVLETKAKSNGSWTNGAWKDLLKEDFGHYSPVLGASLRAALARTNGKFRPNFEKRIKDTFGAEATPLLERVAKL